METNQNKNQKIVVITGASSGIGKEVFDMFVADGAIAVSLSLDNQFNQENFIQCDVANLESVESAGRELKERFGRVDILINNAGIGISGATEMLPDAMIERVMDIDYLGALRVSRVCLPLMDKNAKIVNISSACALFPLPYRGVYCSAKSAMSMLSYSMRMELSRFGIKVITICPGEIKTDFTKNRLKFSETNEKYGDSPRLSAESIDSKNDHRMPAIVASKKIFKIASKKTGTLYIIGGKYKMFYYAQKMLPTCMFNAIINKIFNKK
ncbi:MAG: SDR family NAD(P)-dependent oxidoreductase [Firmicutes bacterium]|nr:SDR family NAD(P)-dependent oxidoreductase [Bacillota bacterium]